MEAEQQPLTDQQIHARLNTPVPMSRMDHMREVRSLLSGIYGAPEYGWSDAVRAEEKKLLAQRGVL